MFVLLYNVLLIKFKTYVCFHFLESPVLFFSNIFGISKVDNIIFGSILKNISYNMIAMFLCRCPTKQELNCGIPHSIWKPTQKVLRILPDFKLVRRSFNNKRDPHHNRNSIHTCYITTLRDFRCENLCCSLKVFAPKASSKTMNSKWLLIITFVVLSCAWMSSSAVLIIQNTETEGIFYLLMLHFT